MQLWYLVILQFCNLCGVVIDFVMQLIFVLGVFLGLVLKVIWSYVLIGQNGVGKFNLIEVLIIIFCDVDLDCDVVLDYMLKYEICGYIVKLQVDIIKQKWFFVWVDGEVELQGYLLKN